MRPLSVITILLFSLFFSCDSGQDAGGKMKALPADFKGEILVIENAFIEPEKVTRIRLYDKQNNVQPFIDKLDGKFTNLSSISINGVYKENEITTLPDAISQLPKLKAIYIRHNQLTELPPTIGTMQNLERLEVDANRITKLPNKPFSFKETATVNLQHNKLQQLPDNFSKSTFTVLNLTGNPLKKLPANFGELKHLTNLVMDKTELTDVPPSFYNLKKLKVVSLVGTKIPENKIAELKKKLPNCVVITK